MSPLVLVDLFGLEKLSNAFGLVQFFNAVGSVTGSPIAGLYSYVFLRRYSFLPLKLGITHCCSHSEVTVVANWPASTRAHRTVLQPKYTSVTVCVGC